MHCKMNWKEASLGVCSRGALFHKFYFCNPYSYYSRFFFFFFHYLRCFFLTPISMLRFSAPFPILLTPLDPFRFLYVFVNILAPFSYFCLLPLFSVSFIIFAAPWFLSYFLFDLKILNILAPFLILFPFFIGSFSFNLFLLSLMGRHPCVFLFLSFFLLISSHFCFSFAYFLSLPFSPSLAPFFFPFFSPFPCFFLFRPSFLAPLLDPPGCKRTLCTPQDTPLDTPCVCKPRGGTSIETLYGKVPPKWVVFWQKIPKHGSHFWPPNP